MSLNGTTRETVVFRRRFQRRSPKDRLLKLSSDDDALKKTFSERVELARSRFSAAGGTLGSPRLLGRGARAGERASFSAALRCANSSAVAGSGGMAFDVVGVAAF